MRQFLQGFDFWKILLLALTIRLLLSPLTFHSDLTTNTIWGIYAKEFGLRGYYDWLSFGNYARPEYPPLSTVLFMIIRYLWQGIFNILWFLNINIPVFPSKLVTWFDMNGNLLLLKLPGILGDIGIGYLIFKVTRSKFISSLYLFNPAVIYLTAAWGQTESMVGFFALWGIILLMKKKYMRSFVAFFVSLMTKATMLPISVIAIVTALKQKIKLGDVLRVLVTSIVFLTVLGYFFTDHAYLIWMVNSYLTKFVVGPFNLGFINLNAFNFWGLLLGLERIPVGKYFLPAWGIFLPFFLFILYKFYKGKNIFFACLLVSFASFLFLPRMHERYMYPVFLFFPLVVHKFPKLTKIFYILSFIFFVNLYHWWARPPIAPLTYIFNLELVERGLSFVNLAGFGYLLWNYQSS